MKIASLFSGAGGLDLGLQQAGHEIILQCEIDAGAQQVLRQKFPGKYLHSDICSLDALPEETEVVTAGFPCVDVSRAGKRLGLNGQATVLVEHVFRLLRKAASHNRPVAWVLLENVEALLDRSQSGEPLIDYLTQELQKIGYGSWAHRVINTAGFGLPHSRRRVFVIASWHADARDILLTQLFEGKACYRCHRPRQEDVSYAIDMGNAQSPPSVDFLPTIKTGNDRICLLLSSGQYGMLRVEDAERAQGFPEGWTKSCYPVAPPGAPAHKLPAITDAIVQRREAERWALLGNAVSVDVARWLGERLRDPHRLKYTAGSQDQCFPQTLADAQDLALVAQERCFQAHWDWDRLGDSALYAFSMRASANLHKQQDPRLADDLDGPTELSRKDMSEEEFQQIVTGKAGPDQIFTVDLGYDRRQVTTAWPQAAWYARGLGRFKVMHMSEAPVLQPLIPLAAFVGTLGAPPSQDSLQIWVQRMKEHGFEVSPTIKKALQCGAQMQKEVNEVVRLKGGLKDEETVGVIGWAKSTENLQLWWPVEILDPFHMPLTRILPPASALALTLDERKASIPSSASQKPKSTDWLAEMYLPKQAEVDVPSLLMKPRKVLVRHLGEKFCSWRAPEQLLPFRKHQSEKEVVASELEHAHKLPRAAQFKKALKEAKELLEVKEGTANGAALAAYAASRAAAINQHARCQRCETCLTSTMNGRRCLYIRSAAAAAAGHAGAQLAILGEAARGAKIKVWWPLDEDWYEGTITAFDELRIQHTICYADGDVEFLRLWAPNQRVLILSEPKAWAQDFAVYEASVLRIKQSVDSKLACIAPQGRQSEHKPESAAAELTTGGEEQLNEYEQARLQRIQRNQQHWEALHSGEPTVSDHEPSQMPSVEPDRPGCSPPGLPTLADEATLPNHCVDPAASTEDLLMAGAALQPSAHETPAPETPKAKKVLKEPPSSTKAPKKSKRARLVPSQGSKPKRGKKSSQESVPQETGDGQGLPENT